MTAVVLRCPHCGTTRGSPGECEACHEAGVRYYCTNHKPGRWLDGPACGECGARFGEPARRPAKAAPAPSAPAPSPPRAPSSRRGPPAVAVPARRPVPPKPRREELTEVDGGWTRAGERAAPPGEPPAPTRGPWEDFLRSAERARREHAARRGAETLRTARGPRLGGCLVRLVLFGMLLLFALVSGFFVFAGSLFQLFRFF